MKLRNRLSLIISLMALSLLMGSLLGERPLEVDAQSLPPATEYLTASGKDLKYRNTTVTLHGANAHNIEALCSRYGSAGSWGSCNVNSINLTESDYQKLSELGGNHFRFGMAYRWFQDDPNGMFAVLDQHVQWATKHNVWIVWNLFTLPGDCYEGFVIQSCPFWNDANMKNQFKQFWVAMANRYKDDPAVAGYDLLNEPLPPGGNYSTWRALAQEVRDAVAAIAPNQLVFFTSLSDPSFPTKLTGNNIVYEVHDYLPMAMSHSTSPTPYPGVSSEWCGSVLWSRNTINGQSDTYNGQSYPSTSCNNIGQRMSFNWASSNNVPLLVGEWGPQTFGPFSGAYNYIVDRGEAYKDSYKVSDSYYSWKHNKDNWGIFENKKYSSAASMTPWYAQHLQAIQRIWTGVQKPNFSGTTPPPPPPASCGDGVIQTPNSSGINEACDDGNTSNNDQCSSDCRNKCTAPQIWDGTACTTPSNQGIVIQTPLAFDKTTLPATGGTITGTVTYRNSSSTAISVNNFVIAGRPPGGNNVSGPYYDFTPTSGAITLQPGALYTLSASRTITSSDPQGQWYAYSTYNDSTGWHDASTDLNKTFTVGGSTLPEGCKADYNSNGTVDISDFQTFGQNYKVTSIQCSLDVVGGDCFLSIADFQAFGQLYKVTNACSS